MKNVALSAKECAYLIWLLRTGAMRGGHPSPDAEEAHDKIVAKLHDIQAPGEANYFNAALGLELDETFTGLVHLPLWHVFVGFAEGSLVVCPEDANAAPNYYAPDEEAIQEVTSTHVYFPGSMTLDICPHFITAVNAALGLNLEANCFGDVACNPDGHPALIVLAAAGDTLPPPPEMTTAPPQGLVCECGETENVAHTDEDTPGAPPCCERCRQFVWLLGSVEAEKRAYAVRNAEGTEADVDILRFVDLYGLPAAALAQLNAMKVGDDRERGRFEVGGSQALIWRTR